MGPVTVPIGDLETDDQETPGAGRPTVGAMTTGRVVGIGVLAGAILLLAVIAGRQTRSVNGSAAAAAVTGPPAVGDCLIAKTDMAALLVDDQGLRSAGRELRSCPDANGPDANGSLAPAPVVVGEVAAVLDERSGRPHDACAAPVAAFLDGPVPSADGPWTAAGVPTLVIVNPDRRQWADGQRWQACVLVPPMWTADGSLDPARGIGPWWRESARGRWADPAYRDRLGECVAEYRGAVARLSAPVSCGSSHDVERLGLTSDALDARSAALLRQSCADLAAARIAAADPTYGGQVRVEVVVTASDGTSAVLADTDTIPIGATAECVVRPVDPMQVLTATVVGLATAPVPLTPR